MARTLKESPITTPAARGKLKAGIHWRRIDAETHLGYRKGVRAGRWLVRWPVGGSYAQKTLGTADDTVKVGTLSYDDAVRAARRAVEQARLEERATAQGNVLTVADIAKAYVAARDKRAATQKGRAVRSDANQRLSRYLLGQQARGKRPAIEPAPLATVAFHALTERDLHEWRESLPEGVLPSTRQRLCSDLKAALNAGYERHKERLPLTLPIVIKSGLRATEVEIATRSVARDNQILSDAEISRLLKAAKAVDDEDGWEGDLYRLLLVLAATGARFSQVKRMEVRDVMVRERALVMPPSFKGRAGASDKQEKVLPVGDDVIEALLPAYTGRDRNDVLLQRWRYGQAPGGIEWVKDSRGPWKESAEFTRPWNKIRKRANLPSAIVYSLRHSSIVRGLRAGLPIRLVASLHDTSTAMIERHYARYIVDGLHDLARKAVVPLVTHEDDNVVRLA